MRTRASKVALLLLLPVLGVAGITVALIPPAHAVTVATVVIQGDRFTPQTITVVVGVNNTVTWTNKDTVEHEPTANDGSWGGPTTPNGGNFTHTFTTPGSYPYHCAIHTFMTGTVVVLSAGGTTTSTTPSTTAQSTSTTTTTTVASSSTTSSPSTSTSSGGIPEFPYSTAAILALTVLVAASYLLARKSKDRGILHGDLRSPR